jgi:hypothetical protein
VGGTPWEPANALERDLAQALADGQGREYARLLRSARLLVPDLPEPGTQEEQLVAGLLPPGVPYVLAYTSPESLSWAWGHLAAGYEELDFATLRQRWPDRRHQLAVNAGCPIATFLSLQGVADLAEGRQSLLPMDGVSRVVADEALAQIRTSCLDELAGSAGGGGERDGANGAGEAGIAVLRDDPPANALETALREAVATTDGEAFLRALLDDGPVLLLTAAPVADPDQIFDDGFPWRLLGGDQARAVPVFTSMAMLERTGAAGSTSVEVDFLHVLANWPGEDYLLCLNPGSILELFLTGETVLEVVASMADGVGRG